WERGGTVARRGGQPQGPGEPPWEGGGDGEGCEGARGGTGEAPADRDAAHDRGGRRRHSRSDRPGDRGRDPRIPAIAQDRRRSGRDSGLLPEAPAGMEGALVGRHGLLASDIGMDLGIKGKVALVSGGARSLGKQDCLTLAAEGCKLIVLDLNGEGAEATAKEISEAGGDGGGYARGMQGR